MKSKLQQIKDALAAGDDIRALGIANKFQQLGQHRDRIRRAWAAHTNPRNYKGIGYDPAALIADGVLAIKERYGLGGTE